MLEYLIVVPLVLVALSIITLVSIVGSIFILFDAPRRGMSRWWALGTLLLWYFVLPIYFVRRSYSERAPLLFLCLSVVPIIIVVSLHNFLGKREALAVKGREDIDTITIIGKSPIPTKNDERLPIYRIPVLDNDWIMDGASLIVPKGSTQVTAALLAGYGNPEINAVIVPEGNDQFTLHVLPGEHVKGGRGTIVNGNIWWRLLRWGVVSGDTYTTLRDGIRNPTIKYRHTAYLDISNPTPAMLFVWLLTLAYLSRNGRRRETKTSSGYPNSVERLMSKPQDIIVRISHNEDYIS